MSVGGKITEVISVAPNKLWVDTIDRGNDRCAVYCDPAGNEVKVGDILWWQSGKCYWTPADKSRVEVVLKKIGFSGVSRPTTHEHEFNEQGLCYCGTPDE